jgi:hypothetical protein
MPPTYVDFSLPVLGSINPCYLVSVTCPGSGKQPPLTSSLPLVVVEELLSAKDAKWVTVGTEWMGGWLVGRVGGFCTYNWTQIPCSQMRALLSWGNRTPSFLSWSSTLVFNWGQCCPPKGRLAMSGLTGVTTWGVECPGYSPGLCSAPFSAQRAFPPGATRAWRSELLGQARGSRL